MKDKQIYYQALIEIVNNEDNELLNAADIKRMAALAEEFYQKGLEDAKK